MSGVWGGIELVVNVLLACVVLVVEFLLGVELWLLNGWSDGLGVLELDAEDKGCSLGASHLFFVARYPSRIWVSKRRWILVVYCAARHSSPVCSLSFWVPMCWYNACC